MCEKDGERGEEIVGDHVNDEVTRETTLQNLFNDMHKK